MAKLMSKSELIQKIAEQHSNNMTRKDVKGVIESLAKIGYLELKKSGAFLVPGFAKFVVIKKPATKERSGINPFTKEPTIFKAKPARKIIRARPVKAAKDKNQQSAQVLYPFREFIRHDDYFSRINPARSYFFWPFDFFNRTPAPPPFSSAGWKIR